MFDSIKIMCIYTQKSNLPVLTSFGIYAIIAMIKPYQERLRYWTCEARQPDCVPWGRRKGANSCGIFPRDEEITKDVFFVRHSFFRVSFSF